MFGFDRFRGSNFEARYRAFPVAFLDKTSAEEGDKVILPPSALDRLISLHIDYPMLFKVENQASERTTHCGVLEFTADEGRVYLPFWMMENLLLREGDIVEFKNASLPKGTYVKLQPVTSDFLNITNPKAVLEKTLRSYSCLTTGDVIVLNYNNRRYEIEIRETKPGDAISVIETDCNVDFEAPKDYVPPVPQAAPSLPKREEKTEEEATEPEADPDSFLAFSGAAQRLDGKSVSAGGDPVRVPLYTGLTRYPPPDEKKPVKKESNGKNGKNGKFVLGSGNRLLDKLQKDGKLPGSQPDTNPSASASSSATSSAKPDTDPSKKEGDDEDSKKDQSAFKAFSGKGFSLK